MNEQFNMNQEQFNLNQVKLEELHAEWNRLQEMLSLRNSNQDPPIDLYYSERSDEEDMEIDSLTKEPSDTLLMGDEVIITTPERENDEFIKSSIDDLVPIPRESEVTSVCDDLECDMPVNAPLPTTDVREENFDINSPLGEYVVDFLMENVDVANLPRHLVKSIETSNLILEELTIDIGLDDSIPTEIDDGYYDLEGYILFLENLLIEETFSDPNPAVLPKKSTLLVTPPPVSKQFSLRDVERFDLFFSLTQSGRKTRVMETPSFGFHHMPSPRPAAYSPKEVMYHYYHPHHEPRNKIPYDREDHRACFQSSNHSVSDHLHVYI
ncbi:hypothetical protein Tco_0998697 [Tanacetum coccineum]